MEDHAMTVQIPPGFGHAVHHFTYAGATEECSFGYGFSHAGFVAPNAPEDIAAVLHVALRDAGTPGLYSVTQMATGDKYTHTSVTLGGTPQTVGEFSTIITGTGGPTTSRAQQWEALTIKKVTGKGGRKFRGRMQPPGMNLSNTVILRDGTVLPVSLPDFQAQWSAWFGILAGLNLPMVLLHSDETIPPTPVLRLEVKSQAGLQRRRVF
jgi:hypothetical protein